MIRKLLLRLYPAAWRKEYGEELAEVLASRPLTVRTFADVLGNALAQRLRHTPRWLVCSACIIAWIFVNTLLSMLLGGILPAKQQFAPFEVLVFAQGSFLVAASKKGSFSKAAAGIMWFGISMCVTWHLIGLNIGWAYTLAYAAIFGCSGALCGAMFKGFRGRTG